MKRLNTREAAKVLDISYSTLVSWRFKHKKTGKLMGPKYVHLGCKIVYLESDINDWLDNLK